MIADRKKTRKYGNTVGVLGPVLPFRGGVAQHTTLLYRALRNKAEVVMISFSRQYPQFLFPGTSDIEPGYEDYQEEGVKYLLDSLNPFTWWKTVKVFLRQKVSEVFIPWWSVYWTPSFAFISFLLRRHHVKLVFICHNIVEHETRHWKLPLTRAVLRYGNRFIVHSKQEFKEFRCFIGLDGLTRHPMPPFSSFPSAKRTLPRRAGLELLFFGIVRPYKGIDTLLDAISLLKGSDVFLSVVGEWWPEAESIKERCKDKAINSKTEIVDRYVSDQEAADYFARADVVVLPYHGQKSSGVVPLATFYEKPVIASKSAGIADMIEDEVSGLLVEPRSPKALAEAIERLLEPGVLAVLKRGMAKNKHLVSWDSFSNELLQLLQER